MIDLYRRSRFRFFPAYQYVREFKRTNRKVKTDCSARKKRSKFSGLHIRKAFLKSGGVVLVRFAACDGLFTRRDRVVAASE